MALHRRLRQDPAAIRRWLLVAALAWLLAVLVGRAVDRADHAQARWGRTTTVWVTDRAVDAGDDLAGSVRSRSWPAALVPDGALDRLPRGARSAGPLDAGTPVTASAIERASPPRRTIAVPVTEARPPLEEGDRVDVWATSDASTVADGEAATRRVAAGARVRSASDRSVVLEVAPAQVAAVADAAATATITLAGVP